MRKRVVGWAFALVAFASASGAAAQDACGPVWRTINDTVTGTTYQMAAAARAPSYFISHGDEFPSISIEQEWLKHTACATFSVSLWDLGNRRPTNVPAMFDAMQANAAKGGNNNKLHWSRTRTIDGLPAREYLTSRNIELFGTLVYYRTLAVARGNQIVQFNSHWSGSETSPIAERAFRSIRVGASANNPHVRSFALLSEAITKYWMFPAKGYDYTDYFTPALLTEIEKTKARDAAAIKAFGYPRTFSVQRTEPNRKVVRVKHDDATVDWTLVDNGTVLTGIWYRKVS